MCEFCGHYPCDPRCPNAEPDKPVAFCDMCGKAIYEGEDAYRFTPSEVWCEDCIDKIRFTAGE